MRYEAIDEIENAVNSSRKSSEIAHITNKLSLNVAKTALIFLYYMAQNRCLKGSVTIPLKASKQSKSLKVKL